MIKKICISLLTFLSFGVSIYFYVKNIAFDDMSYGTREVILFSIPLTMILVNSNLFVIPKLIRHQGSYARYKKGIDSIFLAISLILSLLHFGIILVATGTGANLFLLIPVSVGIVLITTANTLPRFQLEINKTSSELTQSTHQVWNIVVRPFSLPLFIGGGIMLLCVFLPGNLMFVVFFSILLCTLFVSIFLSYRAYQSHINKL